MEHINSNSFKGKIEVAELQKSEFVSGLLWVLLSVQALETLSVSVWERSALLRSHILPQRSRLGHSSGREVPSPDSAAAAVSDAECHSLILSCSDALDVVSGGIDQEGSVREYVAVPVVLVLTLFLLAWAAS